MFKDVKFRANDVHTKVPNTTGTSHLKQTAMYAYCKELFD